MNIKKLTDSFHHQAEKFRDQLAKVESLPQLTLLGLLTGILAGTIIVLFRWAVEIPLSVMLPSSFENFESLSTAARFWMPFTGALLLGVTFHFIAKRHHATGISHVIDRLQNHQGRMPSGNFINQFVGGTVCLLSGQSVGREGPAVHLGAGCGSLLGQWLRLPNNSLRPLAGCGVAAAIAACFNTPMAGVIFAMEVVMLEYSIAGFIPVTLAAVTGAGITRLAFGPEIAFANAQDFMQSLIELPLAVMVGLAVGLFATVYIRLHSLSCKLTINIPVSVRFGFAGLLTGICAIQVPQIMGIGYDTIGQIINGNLGFGILILILLTKLIVTSISLGVGIPGGVVGPLLFLGACIGGAVGIIAHALMPGSVSAIGFYVVLGMGAMMGATLNTPLAAMMAILELTYNSNIIFPGMLVVITACLTTRVLFKCDGLFQSVLKIQGKNPTDAIAAQLLNRAGVRSVMDRHWVTTETNINRDAAQQLLSTHPHWIFLRESQQFMSPADLSRYLQTQSPQQEIISLDDIPARRYDFARLNASADLYEALQAMNKAQVDLLWVETTDNTETPLGIISRDKIDNYYQV